MEKPIDAYTRGYEKGKRDNLAGHVTEAVFGLLQDDPGGYYAAGYHDGVRRKAFRLPERFTDRKAAQTIDAPASSLETQWYGICRCSSFIPEEQVRYYTAALQAEGNVAAIVAGLTDFIGLTCGRCQSKGQFKIQFLGRVEHSDCGWEGYIGTGSYVGHQFVKIIHSGARAGGSLKQHADRKGERGGWVNGALGFLFVGLFRAALSVGLIPLHVVAALLHPGQTKKERTKRWISAGVVSFALVVGYTLVRFK